jgi:hypothetical protein
VNLRRLAMRLADKLAKKKNKITNNKILGGINDGD